MTDFTLPRRAADDDGFYTPTEAETAAVTAKEQLLGRLDSYAKSKNPMGYYGAGDSFIDQGAVAAIVALLALIESQRATIERVERERDEARAMAANNAEVGMADQALARSTATALVAAEARVTALEAEKAGLREALADPVAVHRNMLFGSIAKPSAMNIAHLYPEVQQMRQALITTLKHFRHPTSAEHETRDKVMSALSHFDDPPLTPMFQALSRPSTEEKNDGA